MDDTHESAFDVKMAAVIRVKAGSEEEARRLLEQYLDCVPLIIDPDETPLKSDFAITEASVTMDDADGPHLFEIDGEDIEDEEIEA